MRANFAASAVHTLIATIPDQRLRELVTEILTAAVRYLTSSSATPEPAPVPGNGRRRHRSRDKARAHWSRARRDAESVAATSPPPALRRATAPRRRSTDAMR